jgi:beta-galactosidase
MRRQPLFFCSVIVALLATAACAAAPQAVEPTAQPVTLSSTRGTVELNGDWRFFPVVGTAAAPPSQGTDWALLRVPGSWMRDRDFVRKGTGAVWAAYDGKKIAAGWYERKIAVPAEWAGRAILLDLARVSTDATVYVDGRRCGTVNWPSGRVDITDAVTPGRDALVRVFVVATTDKAESQVLMGDAPGQNWTTKAQLASGGLIGSVSLLSRPKGAHVADVWVQTSVREKKLRLQIELADVLAAGPIQITASVRDEKGREEKRFTATAPADTAGKPVVNAAWDWNDPRLWDVGQPNLYTLRLTVSGPGGLSDEYAQTFGFREFWVSGRDFYLNGTKLRLRPTLSGGGADRIERKLADGFNIAEIWPDDFDSRGEQAPWLSLLDAADRAGMLLTGIMPHMGWMGGNVENDAEKAAFTARIPYYLRTQRNHPSVVMWGTSGNSLGTPLEPRIIGQREASREYRQWQRPDFAPNTVRGDWAVGAIKAADPTRPVLAHNAGSVGDVYAPNFYANWTPLQEREEWLSDWASRGDMPLWFVEFGTPVSLSIHRARNGFQNAIVTEPFLAEYAAIYLGAGAYSGETGEYRREIAARFREQQSYQSWHRAAAVDAAPAWQEIQKLFITNTWRSWRTWGISGGMIPWDEGYEYLNGKLTPAGEALHAVNGPTLAYIAGPREAFTDKTHHFVPGAVVTKSAVLINDSRAARPFKLNWRATLGGKTVASGASSGTLAEAEIRSAPIRFTLPPALTGAKTDARILLSTKIGAVSHSDTFPFRVFAPAPTVTASGVVVLDPSGQSLRLLKSLGTVATPWKAGTALGKATRLLVIGRKALPAAEARLPEIERFVRGGGRLLVLAQDPEMLRTRFGFRVARHQSRRVFVVPGMETTAALTGLDENDLRDWVGSSTLLEPFPDYRKYGPSMGDDRSNLPSDVRLAPSTYPMYGWRRGNRGAVASGAIEKPHRAGWRPLLEGEFDLAYSPLMEMDLGRGRILWCQMDLEDHASSDPAARRLARQVIVHALTAPARPRAARVVYIGGDEGAAVLDGTGVRYERTAALPANPAGALAVIGSGAPVPPAALSAFLAAGGRAMVLARNTGVDIVRKEAFGGVSDSTQVPRWPEASGLSVSDLRRRTDGEAWLLTDEKENKGEVGAGGLLARQSVGKGVLLYCQIDPAALQADKNTYLRQTRWRQTRALTQLLSNLGAEFAEDSRLFRPLTPSASKAAQYHPDYQEDLALGDEPYRFYNW